MTGFPFVTAICLCDVDHMMCRVPAVNSLLNAPPGHLTKNVKGIIRQRIKSDNVKRGSTKILKIAAPILLGLFSNSPRKLASYGA